MTMLGGCSGKLPYVRRARSALLAPCWRSRGPHPASRPQRRSVAGQRRSRAARHAVLRPRRQSGGPRQRCRPAWREPRLAEPARGPAALQPPIQEASYSDMRRLRRAGQRRKAAYLARIALTPRAVWFGRYTRPNFFAKVRNHLNCAQWMQPGSVPIMIVQRHQGRECNARYQAGGVAEDERTKAWYRDFRQAVGNARVIIGFEPDSIGTISCLARGRRQARRDMLRYGVAELSKLPNATIYLEGTASDWKSPSYTARLLQVHRDRQGARVHAQRDPLRLDQRTTSPTGARCPGWWAASRSWSPPPTTAAGRCTTGPRNGKRINVFCNVRYRGAGPLPNTSTGLRQGRRLPVAQPARDLRAPASATAPRAMASGGCGAG